MYKFQLSSVHHAWLKEDFFCILAFFNQNLRNELRENFFLNLTLLSHASMIDVTHEGVVPVHMTRLVGLARARACMQHHVGLSWCIWHD
jgi:hypothetical protein